MYPINYGGWPNCCRLFNGQVELIVTTDVGPRIIHFGFAGQPNEFHEVAADLSKTGGDTYRLYGGHRLVHSPEDMVRTYCPDNAPVRFEEHDGFVRLTQPAEATTGIAKEMDIRLAPDTAMARVTHRLRNANLWAVQLAPWAISMMAPGGTCIIPLPPRVAHAESRLNLSTVTLWDFTDMADPRWAWGRRYVMLRQDPGLEAAQKVGVMAPDAWIAYARAGHLFVSTFEFVPSASYSDLGSCIETYADGSFLEVETLGPSVTLQPGASVEHTEHWHLFEGVPTPGTEAEVDRFVLPRVQAAQ